MWKYLSGGIVLGNQHTMERGLVNSAGFQLVASGGSGASADQVQGNVASGVADAGNPVKIGGTYNSAAATLANGQRGDVQLDAKGNVRSVLFAADGNSAIRALADNADGVAGNSTGQQLVVLARNTQWNGATYDRQKKQNSVGRLLSAGASTNATVVKASAGDLFYIKGRNAKAAAVFLKLYNKATAPTVGTDTPIATYELEPSLPFEINLSAIPLYFSAGISYALTGEAPDADTTALVAADIRNLNIHYA